MQLESLITIAAFTLGWVASFAVPLASLASFRLLSAGSAFATAPAFFALLAMLDCSG